MIERIIQRFVGVFIPGIIGYLFAWSSLNDSGIEQNPTFSNYKSSNLHFENIPAARHEEESSIRRNTRSLLSFPQPSGDTCDCKTEFKGNKDLKVNYFGNSFVTAEAYDDVIKRRNTQLEKWKMQSSKKSPIRDGTVLYTSNIPIIYPYYGLEVLPLKRLSIPPIELLPLFDDEKASSEGPSTCRGGRARSAEVVCAVIYSHYGKIELASTAGVRTEEESLTVTVFAESLRQMNEALGAIWQLKDDEWKTLGSLENYKYLGGHLYYERSIFDFSGWRSYKAIQRINLDEKENLDNAELESQVLGYLPIGSYTVILLPTVSKYCV